MPPLRVLDAGRRRALSRTLTLACASVAGAMLAGCMRQQQAPSVQWTLLDGRPEALEALRGQVVLVNFWATSCAPCVQEMPQFIALHQRYAARGLAVRAVAVQEDAPAAVAAFAERHRLPFGVVIDNTGAVAQAFDGVRVTPTTWLIDRQGRVLLRRLGDPGFDDLAQQIDAALRPR
jgi:peroxiredoxin